MTATTTKMIRLRSGNGAPLSVVSGTAKAAASDTAPRNPAQLVTKRWRKPTARLGRRRLRSTARPNEVLNSTHKNRVTIVTPVTARAR